jgi:acetyl-CoA synthetase
VCDSYDRAPLIANRAEYEAMHAESVRDPAGFWATMAADFYWQQKWQPEHHSYNWDPKRGRVGVEWFKGGKTNMCYNCLDRCVF